MLITFGGLPGTGKTSLARELSRRLPAVYLRIDAIEHGIQSSGCIQGKMNDAGYRAAYCIAAENLALGFAVVADSVNPLAITRNAWLRVAESHGSALVEIELLCSDKQKHQYRVETRCADMTGFLLPSWQEVQDREYEPWDRAHLIIDTAEQDIETCVQEIFTYLQRTQAAALVHRR